MARYAPPDVAPRARPIPASAGVGLKPEHYTSILEDAAVRPGWVEVHPENYMMAGGPAHGWLTAVREILPLSFHGVGLSLGSADGLDAAHLDRLAGLVDRYQPAEVSEHLSWSRIGGVCLHDLLPLPLNAETLAVMAAAVSRVQDRLRRRILIENPSTYLAPDGGDWPEVAFMAELCSRTGCGWLLDINNVHVSATNHQGDAGAYIDSVPTALVGEIHLAGHAVEHHGHAPLLIDDHGSEVSGAVWALYGRFLARAGRVPTLVEWDTRVPAYPVLMQEAARADRILATVSQRNCADAA